jgi:hypothetical protein
MIAALLARPHSVDFRGERIVIRRPRVVDLVAAIDAQGRGTNMNAWLVLNHVMDGDKPAFESMDDVLQLDGVAVLELSREIDKLYLEGLDSTRQPAKS